jgi:hypothetical protein
MHRNAFFVAWVLLLVGAGCGEPKTLTLDVPFTSQAPEGDWSDPWQNACEEASIAMVDAYYAREAALAPRKAAEDILRIFNVKNGSLGPSADESAETIVRMVEALGLDWTARVSADPAVETLEAELDAGHPVIAPVFAPILHNRIEAPGEPDYHAVVLIGYDRDRREFIVNDPGTASGKGLRFGYDLVMDAIHDLHPEAYRAGRKAVVLTDGPVPSSAVER